MDITDVRIRLLKDTSDRLKAFCTVTFDDEFVVRDIKIVDGTSGLFIAMPSKKVTFSCPNCRHRNQLRAKYCEECGERLEEPSMGDGEGRDKLHRDMAHPITSEFRAKLQDRIIEAFNEEFSHAGDPDYRSGDEEEQQVEAEAPKSEYNSMIAGLSGGVDGNRADGDQGNSRRDNGGRRSRSDKPRGKRNDRDKPCRESKPSSEKTSDEKPAARKPRKPRPTPEPVAEKVQTQEEVVESDGFGDGLDVSTEAESTVASVDPCEDSTAFGSGIL